MALLKIIGERKLELSMKNDRKIIAKKLKNHQRKRYIPTNAGVSGPLTQTLLPTNANVSGTTNANVAILNLPFPGVIGVPRTTRQKNDAPRHQLNEGHN